MKATLTFSLALAALALLVAAPAAMAADDDVPSINKRGDKDNEKKWVAEMGTAIVKAARDKPADLEMDTYKFSDPKKDHKELKITMKWKGSITKTKVTSEIVVKIDTSDEKKWEVTNIEYKDDNKISLAGPNVKRIQELIKKINK